MSPEPNDLSGNTGRLRAILDPLAELEHLRDKEASAAIESCQAARRMATNTRPNAKFALVVDDEVGLAKAYRKWLLADTPVHFVDIAGSVATARTYIREQTASRHYSLLVVDYRLTNGTARELIEEVRTASYKPLVYTILISGRVVDSRGLAFARELGANAWLPKPFDNRQLSDAVNVAFAQMAAMR